MGITDKYWATALIPAQANQPFQARFSYFDDGRPRYQTDFPERRGHGRSPASRRRSETHLFAGAKDRSRSSTAYEDGLFSIDRSSTCMIDWGWFYFITKPMFYVLDLLLQASSAISASRS